MADRAWLETQKARFGVEMHVWGRSGDQAIRDLESALSVKLGEQVESFIRTVGNAGIGGFMVIISGTDDGATSALVETKKTSQRRPIPPGLLKVMDHAGESYFLDLGSGEVVAFDSFYIDPAYVTQRFNSFDDFLASVFEDAKAAMNWPHEAQDKPKRPGE